MGTINELVDTLRDANISRAKGKEHSEEKIGGIPTRLNEKSNDELKFF